MKRIILFLLLWAAPLQAQPIERGKGYVPPKPEVRKKLHAQTFQRHGYRMAMKAATLTLPASFDCRDKGWVHAMGDQGPCGSCYLYSTIYGTMTSAFIKAGYGKADGSLIMSVQYGMDCHDFGGCGGGWGAEVIDWAMKNGWYAESWVDEGGTVRKDYPGYTANSKSCRKVSGAKLWRIADWGFATGDQSNRPATTMEVKTSLFTYGPLNVAVDASGQFMNGSGTITSLGNNINHEIELVAWDDAKDGGAFLLKNQWSEDWGNGGFRWITYAAAARLTDIFWVSATALPPPPPPVPPVPPVPPIPPVPPAPPVPVDFPLDVSGDTYIVVRTLPVEIRATLDGDFYDWSYPAGVSAIDKDKVLKITAAPNGPLTINCKVSIIDWEAKKVKRKFSQVTIVIPPKEETRAPEPQPHEATATEEPPLTDYIGPPRTFFDARRDARKAGTPLVVFVGCKPQPNLPFDVYEVSNADWKALTGESGPGVIVEVGTCNSKMWPPLSTIEQIRLEVYRMKAPVQPPVQAPRAPTLIQWSR